MRKLAKHILAALIIATNLAIVPVALAETQFTPTEIPTISTLPGPPTKGARDTLINIILPRYSVGLVGFVGGIGLVFVIIGGVRFTMVYGNEENAETAKKQVIWGLVGILVALFSYAIVKAITRVEYVDNTSPAVADEQTFNEMDK